MSVEKILYKKRIDAPKLGVIMGEVDILPLLDMLEKDGKCDFYIVHGAKNTSLIV